VLHPNAPVRLFNGGGKDSHGADQRPTKVLGSKWTTCYGRKPRRSTSKFVDGLCTPRWPLPFDRFDLFYMDIGAMDHQGFDDGGLPPVDGQQERLCMMMVRRVDIDILVQQCLHNFFTAVTLIDLF
jgi:hypothetical protein